MKESIDLSDRALKNYEGRGKLFNAIPNLGSELHKGAKLAQFYGFYAASNRSSTQDNKGD
jgi:hypothetical protein